MIRPSLKKLIVERFNDDEDVMDSIFQDVEAIYFRYNELYVSLKFNKRIPVIGFNNYHPLKWFNPNVIKVLTDFVPKHMYEGEAGHYGELSLEFTHNNIANRYMILIYIEREEFMPQSVIVAQFSKNDEVWVTNCEHTDLTSEFKRKMLKFNRVMKLKEIGIEQ